MKAEQIEMGLRVLWNDPDPMTETHTPGEVVGWHGRANGHPPYEDSPIEIAFDDGGYADAYPSELEPEDEDADIEREIRAAEDRIEAGQARWAETGSSRRR